MNIIEKTVEASNTYEFTNTQLKNAYMFRFIQLYNAIVSNMPGYRGSFGTGYPFYALDRDFTKELPIIDEQIRYNGELLREYQDFLAEKKLIFKKEGAWECETCLERTLKYMPNLKAYCNSCPVIPKELRPRKIINRLPDLDLWMVVEDGYEKITMEKILEQFDKYDIHTSDENPIKSIDDVYEIAQMLKQGIMPLKHIPIDAHIICYGELYELIKQVPETIDIAVDNHKIPYIPILPYSLRKKWQHDDAAYNFIHDYLYALTEYNFESNLLKILKETRKELVNKYSVEQLQNIAVYSGNELVARRQQSPVLQYRFEERINSWKEL